VKDMDHVTRNAILELTSQLGQPLRDELKIAFSELVGNVEKFQKSLQEMSSSMRDSQGKLIIAADELLPKMEAAKKEFENGVKNFSDSAESLRIGFFKDLDNKIIIIMNSCEKIVSSLSGELSYISDDLRTAREILEKSSKSFAETGQKLEDTTAGLRKKIDDWSGLLRATGHAHSKELEALSSEVSELIINMKMRVLEEIDEQVNARDNRIRQDMAENNEMLMQLLKRSIRIERFIMTVLCVIVLLVIVTHFLL